MKSIYEIIGRDVVFALETEGYVVSPDSVEKVGADWTDPMSILEIVPGEKSEIKTKVHLSEFGFPSWENRVDLKIERKLRIRDNAGLKIIPTMAVEISIEKDRQVLSFWVPESALNDVAEVVLGREFWNDNPR
jgi:hypothetical protein